MSKDKNKKQQEKIELFKDLKSKIHSEALQAIKIPSILEFIESKSYLGLPWLNPPVNLYDLQKLVLKCFYRGSEGNESLVLTKDDLSIIEKNGLNHPTNGSLLDKWNEGSQFRELVLVWGRRCLSENCEILDVQTGKLWSIGDLWNYGKTVVDSWTFDESTKTMTVINGCNIIYQGKKEVYKIQTASGHEIEVTDNHPMLTEDGWVQCKDLKQKTKIGIVASQSFFGSSTDLSEDEASLLGYLSSNCCDSVGTYIATTLAESLLLEEFKKTLHAINADIKVDIAENYNIKSFDERKYNYIVAQKAATTPQQVEQNIISFLSINGIKNKNGTQKFVPARIFVSPKNIVAAYLKSIFSCDGLFLHSKLSRFSCKIEACFSNINLAKGIQHLLSRFGVFSTIQSKIINSKAEHVLLINKSSYVKQFVKEIGVIGHNLFVAEVNKNVEGTVDFDAPVFSAITQIKRIGIKRTFDIQVSDKPHLQNFASNGFVCHNCVSEDGVLVDARTGERFTFKQAWKDEKIISSWTYDEKQNKMVIIDNCGIMPQGRRVVYKITSSTGHEIEVTDNHPMLTQRGWVECKNLETGDKIAITESVPFFGSSKAISEDEAAVLGYITGDGCCSQASIFFTAKNEEIRSDLEKRLNKISDNLELVQDTWTKADSKKYAYKIRSREFVSLAYYDEENQRKISTRDKNDLTKLLIKHNLMGKTSHDKRVPDELFNCPKNVISAYLKALFSCDGWVSSYTGLDKKTACIGFTTVNYYQAKDIQNILHKFGIIAKIRKRVQKTKINTENNCISYSVEISKYRHIEKFIKDIGFIGKNKEKIKTVINICKGASYQRDSRKPYIFSKIVSIDNVGEKDVFDLQVSDQEHLQNFVCQGFCVKNSGKDFICSVVALYEAMRLLEAPGGNPYKMYNLSSATPFTILTIANSSTQAKILFREIKDKVMHSEYFRDKILPEGVTADSIHFLTPEDKKNNEELVSKGFAPNLGSIVVKSGHSNSDTLVGISCYVLLLDEIGLYKNTQGSSSGDAIFNSLAPAVKTYVREMPKIENGSIVLDAEGKTVLEKVYDGKIICLSTPRGKEGIFFDLYDHHVEVPHRLVCKAATWQVNPNHTKEGLMAAFPSMPEEKFRMEFGAEFSGTAGESFFSEEDIESCFSDKSLKEKDFGVPGLFYFAHLDPATSSHNYALVVAHKEVFFDYKTSKKEWRIVVDHIKYWSPSPGKPISVEEVDDYVASLNMKFCLGVVTYDHFNSQASIVKLRKKGIPTKMTPFTKQYKNIIYDNLYQTIIQKRLLIPNHLLLKNEMKNLQRKWLNNGYKVYPKKDGDVTTDDICDALAGACYNCMEKELNKLPQGKLVSLPVQGSNDIVWRSMSGQPYGVGPGQQVARKLEQRNSYPQRGV